jgi:hypothetical protein
VNLLAKETRISLFGERQKTFSGYYRMHDYLCICSNTNGLREELGFLHDPEERRLLIDESKLIFKGLFYFT